MNKLFLHLSAVACLGSLISCGKKDGPIPPEPSPAPLPQASEASTSAAPTAPEAAPPPPPTASAPPVNQSGVMTEHLGDFGSADPVERADLPTRGSIHLNPEPRTQVFRVGEHWEQYDFPIKAKRSGRYRVKISYTLKNSSLGVQAKLGEQRIKKQLRSTGGVEAETFIGEIQFQDSGDHFFSLYTPGGVGYQTFFLKSVTLVPTFETPVEAAPQSSNGQLELLAKHAVTWSEVMRYEPKTEKNCLGFWTDVDDFAEWEFEVTQPGKYVVNVHQGCGGEGGSKVNVVFESTKLPFTVQQTGGYQNWQAVEAGQIEISKPGRYRLAVKPEVKTGPAIMDIQKIVLKPVS